MKNIIKKIKHNSESLDNDIIQKEKNLFFNKIAKTAIIKTPNILYDSGVIQRTIFTIPSLEVDRGDGNVPPPSENGGVPGGPIV